MSTEKEIQVSVRVPASWAIEADEIALAANRDGLTVQGTKNPVTVKRTHVLRTAIQQGMRHARRALETNECESDKLAR